MAARTLSAAADAGDAPIEKPIPVGVLFALGSVYFVWGSTYFGMRIALETLTPFVLGAIRFLAAGAILFGVLRLRGTPWPTARQWVGAAITGALMLTFGNGLVAVAQSHHVDSGVAATVVATMPVWMAIGSSFFGERPSVREIGGLLVGLVGVGILQTGGSLSAAGGVGALAILGAPITWAAGSLLSRRLAMPSGMSAAAAQMICGGVFMGIIAAVSGEHLPTTVDLRSTGAVAYLVVFGSLLGFTAYGYLLRKTRPTVASSYAYVNPIVALLLGAIGAGEDLSTLKLAACAIVIASVVLVVRKPARSVPAAVVTRSG